MAEPITWRNVGSAGLNPAALLAGAQQSFNSGFGALGKAIENQRTLADTNWQIQGENNTNTYLDAVSGYTDPAQLQQAMGAGGALTQLRSQLGGNIDAKAVRGAGDVRVSALQQQLDQTARFQDAQRTRNEREFIDSVLTQARGGDVQGARQQASSADLMNNAAVLGDIYAIEGNQLDRRYKAAGESRAEQANARAGASHSLQMQIGREGLAWNQYERGRQKERNQAEDAATQLLQSTVATQLNADQATWDTINKLGTEMGMPMINGTVDRQNMTIAQTQAFGQALKAAGVAPPPSSTSVLDTLQRQLATIPHLPVSTMVQAGQQVAGLVGQGIRYTPEDKARLDKTLTPENTRYESAVASIDREYQRLKEGNPYAADKAFDPYATAADLTSFIGDSSKFDPVGLNSGEREDLVKSVMNALNTGIEIKQKDGSSEHITVTPGMAQLILNQVKDNYSGVGADFTKLAEQLVKQDPNFLSKYQEGINAFNVHQQQIRSETSTHIGNTRSIGTRFNQENGIRNSEREFLNSLLNN